MFILFLFGAIFSLVILSFMTSTNQKRGKIKERVGYFLESDDDELLGLVAFLFLVLTLVSSLLLLFICKFLTVYNFYAILIIFVGLVITRIIFFAAPSTLKTILISVAMTLTVISFIANISTSLKPMVGIPESLKTGVSVAKDNQKINVSLKELANIENNTISDASVSYSKGYLIYQMSSSFKEGLGVVLLDPTGKKAVEFIKSNNNQTNTEFMNKAIFNDVVYLKIVVDQKDAPYLLYAVLVKPHLFEPPIVQGYILKNIVTGVTTRYLKADLPEFAYN